MTSQTPHRSSEDLQHQNYIWAGIIATVISAQCHILMMAQELEASHSEKAHWTEKEVDELVLYLFTNREKVGDTGNFKDVVYNAAAEHIAEHWQQGARKTGAMCKTKWGSATTASTMLGFQSSVNRLTDVIAERMSSTADRLIEQRSRAMQMLQFEDNEMPFEERLLILEVFARDPVSTDIYTQTTDPDLRRAFILSAARRLPPS